MITRSSHAIVLLTTLMLFLSAAFQRTSAQNVSIDLYGFCSTSFDSTGTQFLYQIDLDSGVSQNINPAGIWGWPHAQYASTINAEAGHYAFIGKRSHFNPGVTQSHHFFLTDLQTGAMVKEFQVPGKNGITPINELTYDCSSGTYYAIRTSLDSFPGRSLVWMDTLLDSVRYVGEKNLQFSSVYDGVIDHSRNAYVFIGRDVQTSKNRIVSLDLQTGQIIDQPEMDIDYLPMMLTYNCLDSTLYAFLWRGQTTTDQRLIRINPVTGHVTKISPEEQLSIYYANQDRPVLDPVGNRFLVLNEQNGKQYFQAIDLTTGLKTQEFEFLGDCELRSIATASPCQATAAYSFEGACAGSPLQFQASASALAWKWNFGDPVSGANNQSAERNPAHVFADTGWYSVQLIARACFGADTLTQQIYVSSPVSVDLGSDTVLCPGDSILFNLPAIDSLSYTWSDGTTGPAYSTKAYGTVSVTAERAGCTAKSAIEIFSSPVSALELGPNRVLCQQATDTLDVSGSGTSFLWQDGSDLSIFLVRNAGTYAVTATDANCSASDSVQVGWSAPIADPFPFGDTVLCPGQSIAVDFNPAYRYAWEDGYGSDSRLLNENGVYAITVTNSDGCTTVDEASVELVDGRAPVIFAASDTLFVQPRFATYRWSLAGVAIPESNAPKQPELLAGRYEVETIDANGCFAKAAYVLDQLPCAALELWPNPTKDQLSIKTHRKVIQAVRLFNTTGQLLFQQQNIDLKKLQVRFPINLATGVYLLEVETNQCTEVRRIVISE